MSKRESKIFLEDILISIEKIEKYTKDIKSIDNFANNEIVVDAVLRNLEIIGEAARNLSEEIYKKYADIPWKNIIGLRNVVIHGYFVVDLEIIWKIIREQLPILKDKIKAIMDNIP